MVLTQLQVITANTFTYVYIHNGCHRLLRQSHPMTCPSHFANHSHIYTSHPTMSTRKQPNPFPYTTLTHLRVSDPRRLRSHRRLSHGDRQRYRRDPPSNHRCHRGCVRHHHWVLDMPFVSWPWDEEQGGRKCRVGMSIGQIQKRRDAKCILV